MTEERRGEPLRRPEDRVGGDPSGLLRAHGSKARLPRAHLTTRPRSLPFLHAGGSLPTALVTYPCTMTDAHDNSPLPPEFERYLALCERTFQRMVEQGEWPWADSPNRDDVVESRDNSNDI